MTVLKIKPVKWPPKKKVPACHAETIYGWRYELGFNAARSSCLGAHIKILERLLYEEPDLVNLNGAYLNARVQKAVEEALEQKKT